MPETIFSSLPIFAVSAAVLLAGQLVYVLFGFGSGLIVVGSLALVFPDIRDVVVLLMLADLPAELLVVYHSRHQIRWRPIALMAVSIAVGIPIGAWLLENSEPALVLKVLGWFLLIVGIVFFRLPGDGRFRPPAWLAPPTGLGAGVLSGLLGTGGPPLIVWYHLSAIGKTAFRFNLMALFLMISLVRLPSYAANGLVTPERMWSSLLVLPFVFLGAYLGNRIHLQISESLFRSLVSVMLILLGVLQLVDL